MTGDKAIGIAVLDRTIAPGWIYVFCQSADGKRLFHQTLPANIWTCELKDGFLHVQGSVKIFTTDRKGVEHELFHNEGTWSVPCEEWDALHYKDAKAHFKAVNETLWRYYFDHQKPKPPFQ